VKRTLADTVVEFLGFSETTSDCINALAKAGIGEWKRTTIWLHDAGLALYFLQKLKDANATDVLPRSILSRLEENLAANRRRVAYMARQFDSLNHTFDDAGVRYTVVKGLSLVPQFCPDASLRHQSDLDYLVDNEFLPRARRALEDAGYSLKKQKNNEFVFLMPSAGMPAHADGQYELHAPHAVELRLAFWDDDNHGVSLAEPRFSVDGGRTQRWQDLVFPTLTEEDAFLLQVIHAFNHILTGWVRMSWLYEIGYFLDQRARDSSLWLRVERRIGKDPLLREMMVVITEFSAQLFKAPVPATSRIWSGELRPAVRLWIQHYARVWVFGENQVDRITLFSVAKFVLFLHQQYLRDANARRHLMRSRLLPWEQMFRRTRSMTGTSSANSGGRRQQLKRALIRVLFHVTGGLRYLWEVPRWRRLNKMTAHLNTSGMQAQVGHLPS
jgi:Uncharacterised nucleotidyltransferase